MDLRSLRIKKFKKISDVTINLDDVNFLIGGNNCGKSSILQAIHTAVSASQSQIEAGGGNTIAEESLRYSPCSNFSLLGHKKPFENRSDGNRARISFIAEDVIADEKRLLKTEISLYKARNARNVGIQRTGHPRLSSAIASLTKPFSIYVPGLAGIPHFEEFRAAPIVLRKLAGGEANLVLRNVILQLSQNNQLRGLINDVRNFYPDIDIKVEYNPLKDTSISISLKMPGSIAYFPLEQCGTGILQVIQIFAYVTLFQPALLLLDEPDAHLHPSNQVKLIEAISLLSILYGTKTILATHSRHLISAANGTANFYWIESGKIKEGGEFDLVSVLMDIGGLDEADIILNSNKEFLFFTEDKNKKPLKMLLTNCGIEPERYDIVSYLGVSNIEATAKIINSLKPFLRGAPQIIVHRDRDFCDDRELSPIVVPLNNHGIKVFVTNGSDIESYFINPEHLAYGTQLSEGEISEIIESCLEEYDEEIRKRFYAKRKTINTKKINENGDNTPTKDLLPDDEWVELRHTVGKEFCTMFRKHSEEKLGTKVEPLKVTGIKIAPDLIELLGN